jgi:hypothetical protein
VRHRKRFQIPTFSLTWRLCPLDLHYTGLCLRGHRSCAPNESRLFNDTHKAHLAGPVMFYSTACLFVLDQYMLIPVSTHLQITRELYFRNSLPLASNITARKRLKLQCHITITKCRTLTRCMNVRCRSWTRKQFSLSVYRVYSVSTDTILIWICEVENWLFVRVISGRCEPG